MSASRLRETAPRSPPRPGGAHESAPPPLVGWRRSWGRIGAMLRKEFRQLFRDPKTKRIMFASPIIQLLLFGYAVNTDVHQISTFVVDHDDTRDSRALQDALTAAGYFRIQGRSDRPADLAAALDQGRATVGVQIPRGFAADLAAGRTAGVQVVVDGSNSNTATLAQGYAARIVQQFGMRHAAARGAALPRGVDFRVRAWYNPDLASRVYNVPGVIGALLLLMCLLLTALAVVRERELGTLEQLLVSPVSPGELILGKTIPVAAIALMDLALISGVAVVWFRVPFRGSVSALLLASLLFILACLGLGLLISTISRTQQEAFMTMFLLLLPALILSGFLYPVRAMPEVFQWLTLLNPVRYFLEVVRAIFLKGSGVMVLWPQFLALAAMAGALLWLATWRFKRALA